MTSAGKKSLTNLYAEQAQQLSEQSVSYGKMKVALKSSGTAQQSNMEIAIADLKKYDRELHNIHEEITLAEVRKGQMKFQKVPNVKSMNQWLALYGGSSKAAQQMDEPGSRSRRGNNNSSQLLVTKATEELVKVKNRISRVPEIRLQKAPELTTMDQWRELYGK